MVTFLLNMETKTILEILLMIQPKTLKKVVVLNYEESEFIFCDDIKDKFPTWKTVEKEVSNGQEYIVITSDSIYYMVSTEEIRKYFSV